MLKGRQRIEPVPSRRRRGETFPGVPGPGVRLWTHETSSAAAPRVNQKKFQQTVMPSAHRPDDPGRAADHVGQRLCLFLFKFGSQIDAADAGHDVIEDRLHDLVADAELLHVSGRGPSSIVRPSQPVTQTPRRAGVSASRRRRTLPPPWPLEPSVLASPCPNSDDGRRWQRQAVRAARLVLGLPPDAIEDMTVT